MRRLVIETAGPACSVALFDDAELLACAHERVGRGHAERLLPMIAELAPTRVDEVLVDRGPGSFTGLRVGLAAAIGLGIGWACPVRGYDALALLAVPLATDIPSTLR